MATAQQSAGDAAKAERQRSVNDLKRQMILDAARTVFESAGLEGASIRAIAKRAGYTPGAIYFHYPSKEEIYGDLLSQSLERLHARIRDGMKGAEKPAERLAAGALALFDYYSENPRDLDLGFYLFNGMRPQGLTRELNTKLNRQLRAILGELEAVLWHLGASGPDAARETAALFSHEVGLLLMMHTGRIRIFGLAARPLMEDYIRLLIARVTPCAEPG